MSVSILQKLTVRHLLLNRRRTLITIIGIVLSVAMVTAVSGMVVSTQDLLYRDSVATEGLWHVRYSDVPEEFVAQIVQEPVFSEWELLQTEEGPVLSLQFSRLGKKIFDQSEAVCWKYGIGEAQVRYHNNLLIAKGVVPGPYYGALYTFGGILLLLIATGSVLVISNAFAISADQRSLQFGLLKSAGATKSQIRGMVLFEGVVLAAAAIPLGILAGILVQWVALSIANGVLEPMMVNLMVAFRVVVTPAVLAVAAAAAAVTVLLAAWFPARRAAAVSAVEAIRQTRSIRLSRSGVRVPPLTGRLFGLEGVLAAKAMSRNRGKYRATVLALVVSIVLFIGVSSFGNILMKAVGMVYEDMGSNVLISLNGDTAERHGELAAQMAAWDGVRLYSSRDVDGEARLPEGALTREYLEYFPDGAPPLRLFSIGEADFAALCKTLRISPRQDGGLEGILVNTSGTYIQQGRRINFVPYSLRAGDSFPVFVGDRELRMEIAGTVGEVLPGIFIRFSTSALNIIVSDQAMRQLRQGEEDFLWLAAMAEDPAGFTQRAEELLEGELPFHTWSAMDYDSMIANNRKIGMLAMIFVYGFIGMLTLIGVTSVITTISTNIALRTREFAMLRSVGMTQKAIGRMLHYESLLYGIKALLWGVPLGLAASGLLHKAMTSVMDFPFLWPVQSVLISAVAILLITFVTMMFARRRQRQLNIVEALRDDVI